MDERMFLFVLLIIAVLVTAILLFIIARQDRRILEQLKRIEDQREGKAQK